MNKAFDLILNVHIICATACAIVYWIPMLTRKGSILHIRSGWFFIFLLVPTTLTALAVSTLEFVGPTTLRPQEQGMPLDHVAANPTLHRLFLCLLAYIAVASTAAALRAVSVLRHPERSTARGAIPFLLLAATGLVFVIVGAVLHEIPMALVGAVGVLFGIFTACGELNHPLDGHRKIVFHAERMIACGIGLYSIVSVVVGNRLFPGLLYETPGLIFWALPTLLGIPFIVYLRRRWKPAQ